MNLITKVPLTESLYNYRLMKLQRIIYNAMVSTKHFYTNNFKFDNFNFIDLNLSIPPHEKEDFEIVEKVFSDATLFDRVYAITLKVVFGETSEDEKKAKSRKPYVYLVTRTINLIVIFSALKLFYELVMNLYLKFSL